jgi:hypothetical protein
MGLYPNNYNEYFSFNLTRMLAIEKVNYEMFRSDHLKGIKNLLIIVVIII